MFGILFWPWYFFCMVLHQLHLIFLGVDKIFLLEHIDIYTHIVAVYYISYINYIKAYKQSPIHASNCIPHTEMVWYGLNHLISAPGSWSTLVFYIHTWENGTQLLCLLNLFGGLKPPSTVGFAYWTWNSLKLLQFILFHTEKSLQSG